MDPDALDFEHVFEPGPDDDPAYVAVLLHGTGADQHDLVPLGRRVAPEKPLLSPLGKVRENGMPRWFRRLEEGVFDTDDLRRRAAELAAFLGDACDAYDLDPGRLVAVGFSNGANVAAALLLLHPDVLRGAVLLRAMVPLEPDAESEADGDGEPDLHGVPVLIASGTQDRMIPAGDAERLARMLEEAGADVTQRFADAGHGLTGGEVEEVRRWLDEHEDAFTKSRGTVP